VKDNMNPLKFTQLIADNKTASRSFVVTAKADGGMRIDLYDVIDDYYGVSASAFVSALNSIKEDEISLHINSPGGDVFAARAMVAAIAAHPSTITAYVDGLAASAASYVAVACDKVVMQKGSMLMVHRASSIVWGNASDMVETASLLDKIDATIAADYSRKTGKPEAEMMALMAAETWLSADESLVLGFADEVIENEKGKPKNTWNLSAYEKAPLPPPDPDPTPPEPAIAAGFFMSGANANRLRLLEI
jgi:ATP-dependent Clp protease protease subunit